MVGIICPPCSNMGDLTGSQALPGNRCHSCSASAQTMEAEPPDMRYQALPGNEYNPLGLLEGGHYLPTLLKYG